MAVITEVGDLLLCGLLASFPQVWISPLLFYRTRRFQFPEHCSVNRGRINRTDGVDFLLRCFISAFAACFVPSQELFWHNLAGLTLIIWCAII